MVAQRGATVIVKSDAARRQLDVEVPESAAAGRECQADRCICFWR
jgi:hypothetical protein